MAADTAPAPLVFVPADAPRVVLIGPPGGGKTTLWGRLLTHAAGWMPADQSPIQVVETGRPPRRFVVADTDGAAAADLFTHPDALSNRTGGLASEVRQANALVVVVDAAASASEVAATFAVLAEFLAHLTVTRIASRTVGGLPVILTLTKCDALARPTDSPTDWLRRIEFRKAELEARFTEFFEPESDAIPEPEADPDPFDPDRPAFSTGPQPAFGTLDLDLAATAGRVPAGPAFAGLADATGGFGIVDLADLVFPAAAAHRDRTLTATRRLRTTLLGTGAALALMFITGVSLFLVAADPAAILANRIRVFQDGEPAAAAERYSDARVPRAARALTSFLTDDNFLALPADLQAYVQDRAATLESYRTWRSGFDPPRLGPAEITTRPAATLLMTDLATGGPLAQPPGSPADWTTTRAGRLRAKWQADLPLLLAAEAEWHGVYRDLIRRVNSLILTSDPPGPAWRRQTESLLGSAGPRHDPADAVPGSPLVPGPRGQPLTYASVARFERVEAAALDFAETRARLVGLRDLTDAVGLTTGPGTPGSVLDLPEPREGAVNSLELGTQILAALQVSYPVQSGTPGTARGHFPTWLDRPYPSPVRRAVEARLRLIAETANRHVRGVIQARLRADTVADWRELAATLLTTPALQDWNTLLVLLNDLLDPPPADAPPRAGPVADLRGYLAQDEIAFDWPELTLTLPNDIFDRRPVPTGPLVITITAENSPARTHTYTPAGEPFRSSGRADFPFRATNGMSQIVVRPGDKVAATVSVRAGDRDYQIVWQAGGSAVDSAARLANPPRLETPAGAVVSGEALGIRLTPAPTPPRLLPGLVP